MGITIRQPGGAKAAAEITKWDDYLKEMDKET